MNFNFQLFSVGKDGKYGVEAPKAHTGVGPIALGNSMPCTGTQYYFWFFFFF